MEKTLLLIEDEQNMRRLLCDYFRTEAFSIIETESGEEALLKFKNERIDLVILDIMLPKLDGFTLCKYIRTFSNVPIIILTAKSEEEDKLLGFELGADDYITKPFSPKILVAKVKALLKRAEPTMEIMEVLAFDGLVINDLSHEVKIENETVNLSPKEYDLLLYFVKNKGIALSRDTILNHVWGYDYYGDSRTVDTHIKRLREKLKNKGDLIHTIRGSGYKFEVKNEKE